MRSCAWALLFILSGDALPPLLLAGDPGGRAHYVGGTVAALPSQSEGRINTTDEEVLFFRSNKASVRVPYRQVNTLEYGQKVNRRYISAILISPVLLLAKARKHYLTLGYTDEQGRQQAMVFQVDKRHVRAVLASLEARTGRRIEYQDEEARKAGKG
ncbi:MAG: hypothetical protein HYR60_21385 [Acidobacteria bacterium]|nr:hypothetical protein [Acidobacteriota bacterium]MBI3472083.1 hypothetical protein [Candidatus Solibacter usitatus]